MVTRFQSVISAEIKWQLKEKTGNELPQAVIACVGGGSNAAGAFFHFLDEKQVRLIAVEAAGEGIEQRPVRCNNPAGNKQVSCMAAAAW